MIIEKFLNNNMLLVNDNHEEMIVMGKGLRFHYKVGDEIRDEGQYCNSLTAYSLIFYYLRRF